MENINEKLNSTIKDIALEAIDVETVKEILQDSMKRAVKSVAEDIYGGYRSEFQETLKEHIKEQVKINIGPIGLTDLHKATLDLIKSEFEKIEIENKERVLQEALNTIREITIDNKEVQVSDIQDAFVKYVITIHGDDMDEGYDYCGCDEYNVKKFEDIETYKELVDELYDRDNDDYRIETELNESEWGIHGTYYTVHLNINFIKNGTNLESLSLHIKREKDYETDNNDNYQEDKDNIYRLLGIDFSGGKVIEDGKIPTDRLDPVKKFLASIYLNKTPINIKSLDGIEHIVE